MSNSDYEPEETDTVWRVDAYKEMEYRLNSLRVLVCDLLKTNQELRDALLDAKGDAECIAEPRSCNTPR